MMHVGIDHWSRRPAATPPQMMIAIVATAAITAFCALYLMKSYAEQMTRDMTIALRELDVTQQRRDGCTVSYASAKLFVRPGRLRLSPASEL